MTIINLVAALAALLTFGVAAWFDLSSRRIANILWVPLGVLAMILLVVRIIGVMESPTTVQQPHVIQLILSIGVAIPVSYLFYQLRAFGGADAKALIVLALLFPIYPVITLFGQSFPIIQPPLGVFALTILTNTMLLAMLYPFALGLRNFVKGYRGRWSFLGIRVLTEDLSTTHGKLLETTDGMSLVDGIDLDALRMYLRWRGITLSELRNSPDEARLPPRPEETFPAGDGRVVLTDGGEIDEPEQETELVLIDEWGADLFTLQVDAYGTTPEQLRSTLELVKEADEVWVSPGIPLIVPMFFGILVSLTLGDVLLYALLAL
jgi:preflagellin peptidase FlaK